MEAQMNFSLSQINEHSWGQYVDIEQNIIYIPTNNEIKILYLITSLSIFQIFKLFIIFEYLLFA